jgi:hypothetical protein
MDPFTLALATFGVQKLRGKSTRSALKDAAFVGGGSYALGQAVPQLGIGQGAPFSTITNMGDGSFLSSIKGQKGNKELYKSLSEKAVEQGVDTEAGKATLKLAAENKPGGILGMSTLGKLTTAAALTPLLMGEEKPIKPVFTEEDYKQAYKEQSQKLENAFTPVTASMPTRTEVTGQNMFYANEGGLATALPKFNTGGVNYLPSKVDHDENDVNNYVRATGYVEDGAGVGDKDEDTMLAQLADGEFVSRADAVLGAGILSGADPKNFKGMRKAGSDFFYNQQKQFKRIYDITNGSNKN